MESDCQTEEGHTQPSQPGTPAATCLCTPMVQHKSCSISCCCCAKSVYVACLLQQFKSVGGAGLKNNIEWIKDFIVCTGLRYECPVCREQPCVSIGNSQSGFPNVQHGISNALQSNFDNLSSKISSIEKSLTQLQQDVSKQVATDLSCHNVMTPSHIITLPKPPSYAAAVSGDITKLVKTAVSESMREHKIIERDNACVAVHKMREYGNDVNDFRNLCEYLDCDVHIVSVTRIGQKAQSSKKIRILKVQLQSASDKMKLLKSSKALKEDRSTSTIFFTPWLSAVEMAKLRNLQSRCRQLNDGVPTRKDGRKPYIVISGRLMKRAVNGELSPVQEDLDVASIIATNQPQPLQRPSPLHSRPASSSVTTTTIEASISSPTTDTIAARVNSDSSSTPAVTSNNQQGPKNGGRGSL